jgi:hypothetical protein
VRQQQLYPFQHLCWFFCAGRTLLIPNAGASSRSAAAMPSLEVSNRVTATYGRSAHKPCSAEAGQFILASMMHDFCMSYSNICLQLELHCQAR